MNCFVYNWTIFGFFFFLFFSFIHKQKASKYYSSDDVISFFLQDASAEQKYGWWLKFDKREASS